MVVGTGRDYDDEEIIELTGYHRNMSQPEEIIVEKDQKEDFPNKGIFGWIILLLKIIIKTIIFMMAIFGGYNAYQGYRYWLQVAIIFETRDGLPQAERDLKIYPKSGHKSMQSKPLIAIQ